MNGLVLVLETKDENVLDAVKELSQEYKGEVSLKIFHKRLERRLGKSPYTICSASDPTLEKRRQDGFNVYPLIGKVVYLK